MNQITLFYIISIIPQLNINNVQYIIPVKKDMFKSLKKNIIIKGIKYIDSLPKERKIRLGEKSKRKILKKLDELYFNITSIESILVAIYGLDSQILLDFKDKLNELSIDWDREDTK